MTTVTIAQLLPDLPYGFTMLERRQSRRNRMVLPVKVSIDQKIHLAHTVDISTLGARLGGIREQLKPGATVDLQRGARRARFEIKWVSQIGPNEIQIGIESPDGLDRFWGLDLSEKRDAKQEMQAFMLLLSGSQAKR